MYRVFFYSVPSCIALTSHSPHCPSLSPHTVNSLLDLHDKMLEFTRKEFANHILFQKALKDAFEVSYY